MVSELERAQRVADALDGIGLAVRKIVAGIDRPCCAGARMLGVQDAVEDRIAEVDVARRHVDLGAEHASAVREFAGAHAAEEIEILLDRAATEGAVAAGLGQRTAGDPHLLLALVVDVGLASADQDFGPFVEAVEIVGCVVEAVTPIEAQPAHIADNRVDVLLIFFGRVGVVEAEVAAAAEFRSDTEVEADRLGMADMEIAVGLRREARHDCGHPHVSEVGTNDIADENLTSLAARGGGLGHLGFLRLSTPFAANARASCQPRRAPASCATGARHVPRRHALRPLADRLLAHRRRPHRAVQLALRPPHGRHDAAPDRGHRPRAIDRTCDCGNPRWNDVARARLGR